MNEEDPFALVSSAHFARENENGRTYHTYGKRQYPLPNDFYEQSREYLRHHLISSILEKPYKAPITAMRILDVGTGMGLWAAKTAKAYPDAIIQGVDISLIQREWSPSSNLEFWLMDAENEVWPSTEYDLVFTRHMIEGIYDWERFFKHAFQCIKPGGWVECQEPDYRPRSHKDACSETALTRYWDVVGQGFRSIGIDLQKAPQLAKMMLKAGFINVEVEIIDIPIGGRPDSKEQKEIGKTWEEIIMLGLEGTALRALTKGLLLSTEITYTFLASIRNEHRECPVQMYTQLYIVFGQKPQVKREGSSN